MRDFLISRLPLGDLLRNLADDLKAFVREELTLVRQEMSEKISHYSKHAAALAVGGFAAYAGSIILMAGLGLLIGYGFEGLGLDPLLATFIGFTIAGLAVIIIGAMLALKGWNALAHMSPLPTKAMQAAKSNGEPVARTRTQADAGQTASKPSSGQLQQQVLQTKERIAGESHELKNRATLRRLRQRMVGHVKAHPITWGAAALGSVVLLGGAVVGRKFLKT
ncbi:MAG TPA: phage holin family protein [Desulfuromonadaceae bacterium]|nr:phage holin family protein [Desulfuromonadaceae bacterium]